MWSVFQIRCQHCPLRGKLAWATTSMWLLFSLPRSYFLYYLNCINIAVLNYFMAIKLQIQPKFRVSKSFHLSLVFYKASFIGDTNDITVRAIDSLSLSLNSIIHFFDFNLQFQFQGIIIINLLHFEYIWVVFHH